MRNLIRLFHLANQTVNATLNATTTNSSVSAAAAAKPSGLSGKIILLIVVASLVGFVLIVLLIWGCIKRKRLYEDYNLRPETFIRKPSFTQLDRVVNSEYTFVPVKSFSQQSMLTNIFLKELQQGPVFELSFQDTKALWCSAKFSHLL